jgi:hypothetical protein
MINKRLINTGVSVTPAGLDPLQNFETVTYTGNGSTQKITGYIRKGAAFNGSSSKVDLPVLGLGGNATRSVSIWVNPATTPSTLGALYHSGGTDAKTAFIIYYQSDNKIRVEYDSRSIVTTATIPNNTWTHIVATYNGGSIESSANTNIYINGVLQTVTNSGSATGVANTLNSDYAIGYRRYANSFYFDGKLDQVRIFNTALNLTQVGQLRLETYADPKKSTTDYFGDGSGVALYELDEDASDTGGASGYIGEGGIFNGSSSGITTSLNNNLFTNGYQFSVSMWVNPSTSQTHAPLINGLVTSSTGWYIELNNNRIYTAVTQSGPAYRRGYFNTTLNNGQWYHIAVDLINNYAYLNGQDISNTFVDDSYGTISSIVDADWKIGTQTATNTYYFNGKIDQVRIFNRALDETTNGEVTTLYWETSASATKSTTDIFDDGSAVALYELEGNALDTGLVLADYTPIANRTFESSKNTSAQSTGPRDFEFSSDGTKLFFCDGSNKRIHQYTMTTAWDVSTASHNGYYDVTGQISGGAFPISVQFKSDGTKMYVSTYNASPERIYEYDLSSAWLVTSGVSYNSKFGNVTVQAWGMEFNSAGTILICSSDSASGNLCKYTLSTAWDISTISLSQQVTLTSIKGIDLSLDGKQLLGAYFPASGNKTIKSYSLSTAYDITTLTQREEWDVNSIENTLQTVTCKFDGSNKIDKLYFVGFQQDTIYGYDIDETADFIVAYNGTATNVSYAYNGTPTNVNFLGMAFQPDLVWLKHRGDAGTYHQIYDSVRGTAKVIFSNDTLQEFDRSNGLTSFDSNGFTLGNHPHSNDGTSPNDLVAWCWKAGGVPTPNNNTQGTITSTVSANTDAGFSIVSFTGGSSGTVGHGLSSAPELIITKSRTTTTQWDVYTTVIDGSLDYLELNSTNDKGDSGMAVPTENVFSYYPNSANIIAYCFHSVVGYQKVGSYLGTGTTGNKQTIGFRPRFLLSKRTSLASSWYIMDSTRNTTNPRNNFLNADTSDAEYNPTYGINFEDDGFSFISTDLNGLNQTWIYLAIA